MPTIGFVEGRLDVLPAITKIRREHCLYDNFLDSKEPSFCDCKYGYGKEAYGEKTGCPELRCIELLLINMTDKEYLRIINRKKRLKKGNSEKVKESW